MISSLVFLGWVPDVGGGDVGFEVPERSKPANPFIRSMLAPPLAPPKPVFAAGAVSPPLPNTPSRSSRLLLDEGAPMAGDSTRTGVPARPSRPDMPAVGSFCAEAGAVPSKSISNRFSTLFCAWGAAVPLTAAAAAAAARGFSRAFWSCSLWQG